MLISVYVDISDKRCEDLCIYGVHLNTHSYKREHIHTHTHVRARAHTQSQSHT